MFFKALTLVASLIAGGPGPPSTVNAYLTQSSTPVSDVTIDAGQPLTNLVDGVFHSFVQSTAVCPCQITIEMPQISKVETVLIQNVEDASAVNLDATVVSVGATATIADHTVCHTATASEIFTCGQSGKFIGLSTTQTTPAILTIREVRAYPWRNIAPDVVSANTYSSSVYLSTTLFSAVGQPGNALVSSGWDTSISPNAGGKAATSAEATPWFRYDLGAQKFIKALTFIGRTDADFATSEGWTAYVGDDTVDMLQNTACVGSVVYSGTEVSCNAMGQFVMLQNANTQLFVMSALAIFEGCDCSGVQWTAPSTTIVKDTPFTFTTSFATSQSPSCTDASVCNPYITSVTLDGGAAAPASVAFTTDTITITPTVQADVGDFLLTANFATFEGSTFPGQTTGFQVTGLAHQVCDCSGVTFSLATPGDQILLQAVGTTSTYTFVSTLSSSTTATCATTHTYCNPQIDSVKVAGTATDAPAFMTFSGLTVTLTPAVAADVTPYSLDFNFATKDASNAAYPGGATQSLSSKSVIVCDCSGVTWNAPASGDFPLEMHVGETSTYTFTSTLSTSATPACAADHTYCNAQIGSVKVAGTATNAPAFVTFSGLTLTVTPTVGADVSEYSFDIGFVTKDDTGAAYPSGATATQSALAVYVCDCSNVAWTAVTTLDGTTNPYTFASTFATSTTSSCTSTAVCKPYITGITETSVAVRAITFITYSAAMTMTPTNAATDTGAFQLTVDFATYEGLVQPQTTGSTQTMTAIALTICDCTDVTWSLASAADWPQSLPEINQSRSYTFVSASACPTAVCNPTIKEILYLSGASYVASPAIMTFSGLTITVAPVVAADIKAYTIKVNFETLNAPAGTLGVVAYPGGATGSIDSLDLTLCDCSAVTWALATVGDFPQVMPRVGSSITYTFVSTLGVAATAQCPIEHLYCNAFISTIKVYDSGTTAYVAAPTFMTFSEKTITITPATNADVYNGVDPPYTLEVGFQTLSAPGGSNYPSGASGVLDSLVLELCDCSGVTWSTPLATDFPITLGAGEVQTYSWTSTLTTSSTSSCAADHLYCNTQIKEIFLAGTTDPAPNFMTYTGNTLTVTPTSGTHIGVFSLDVNFETLDEAGTAYPNGAIATQSALGVEVCDCSGITWSIAPGSFPKTLPLGAVIPQTFTPALSVTTTPSCNADFAYCNAQIKSVTLADLSPASFVSFTGNALTISPTVASDVNVYALVAKFETLDSSGFAYPGGATSTMTDLGVEICDCSGVIWSVPADGDFPLAISVTATGSYSFTPTMDTTTTPTCQANFGFSYCYPQIGSVVQDSGTAIPSFMTFTGNTISFAPTSKYDAKLYSLTFNFVTLDSAGAAYPGGGTATQTTLQVDIKCDVTVTSSAAPAWSLTQTYIKDATEILLDMPTYTVLPAICFTEMAYSLKQTSGANAPSFLSADKTTLKIKIFGGSLSEVLINYSIKVIACDFYHQQCDESIVFSVTMDAPCTAYALVPSTIAAIVTTTGAAETSVTINNFMDTKSTAHGTGSGTDLCGTRTYSLIDVGTSNAPTIATYSSNGSGAYNLVVPLTNSESDEATYNLRLDVTLTDFTSVTLSETFIVTINPASCDCSLMTWNNPSPVSLATEVLKVVSPADNVVLPLATLDASSVSASPMTRACGVSGTDCLGSTTVAVISGTSSLLTFLTYDSSTRTLSAASIQASEVGAHAIDLKQTLTVDGSVLTFSVATVTVNCVFYSLKPPTGIPSLSYYRPSEPQKTIDLSPPGFFQYPGCGHTLTGESITWTVTPGGGPIVTSSSTATIQTNDFSLADTTYSLTAVGSATHSGNTQTASVSFSIAIRDFCTTTKVVAEKTPVDMSLYIANGAATQSIPLYQDEATKFGLAASCGSFTYTLRDASGVLPSFITYQVNYLEGKVNFVVESEDVRDAGEHTLYFTVSLDQYPAILPKETMFKVTLEALQEFVPEIMGQAPYLLEIPPPYTVIMQGEGWEFDMQIQDNDSEDDFETAEVSVVGFAKQYMIFREEQSVLRIYPGLLAEDQPVGVNTVTIKLTDIDGNSNSYKFELNVVSKDSEAANGEGGGVAGQESGTDGTTAGSADGTASGGAEGSASGGSTTDSAEGTAGSTGGGSSSDGTGENGSTGAADGQSQGSSGSGNTSTGEDGTSGTASDRSNGSTSTTGGSSSQNSRGNNGKGGKGQGSKNNVDGIVFTNSKGQSILPRVPAAPEELEIAPKVLIAEFTSASTMVLEFDRPMKFHESLVNLAERVKIKEEEAPEEEKEEESSKPEVETMNQVDPSKPLSAYQKANKKRGLEEEDESGFKLEDFVKFEVVKGEEDDNGVVESIFPTAKVLYITERSIEVELDFVEPEMVSSGSEPDWIRATFVNPALMVDSETSLTVSEETELIFVLPKQFPDKKTPNILRGVFAAALPVIMLSLLCFFIMALILPISFKPLWNLIGVVQILVFIKLQVPLPINELTVLDSLGEIGFMAKTTQWLTWSFDAQLIKLQDSHERQQLLQSIGIEKEQRVFKTLLPFIVLFFILVFLALLTKFIEYLGHHDEKLQAIGVAMKKQIIYNGFIRLILISYLPLVHNACAFFYVSYIFPDTDQEGTSLVARAIFYGMIGIVVLIVWPCVMLYLLTKYNIYLEWEELQNQYGAMTLGIRVDETPARIYSVIWCLRRLAIVLALLSLHYQTVWIKIAVFFAIQTAYLIYVGWVQAHTTKLYNRLEAANEFLILILSYSLFLSTAYLDPATSYLVGWVSMGITLFIFLLNYCLVITSTYVALRQYLRVRRYVKKHGKLPPHLQSSEEKYLEHIHKQALAQKEKYKEGGNQIGVEADQAIQDPVAHLHAVFTMKAQQELGQVRELEEIKEQPELLSHHSSSDEESKETTTKRKLIDTNDKRFQTRMVSQVLSELDNKLKAPETPSSSVTLPASAAVTMPAQAIGPPDEEQVVVHDLENDLGDIEDKPTIENWMTRQPKMQNQSITRVPPPATATASITISRVGGQTKKAQQLQQTLEEFVFSKQDDIRLASQMDRFAASQSQDKLNADLLSPSVQTRAVSYSNSVQNQTQPKKANPFAKGKKKNNQSVNAVEKAQNAWSTPGAGEKDPKNSSAASSMHNNSLLSQVQMLEPQLVSKHLKNEKSRGSQQQSVTIIYDDERQRQLAERLAQLQGGAK